MKRNTHRRWISLVLAVCMALTMTSGFAFAEDANEALSSSAVADSGKQPVTRADLISMVNDLRTLDLTSKDAVLEKQNAIRAAFNESAEKTRLDELTEALAKFLREDRPELNADDVGPMLDALTGVALSDRVDLLAAKTKIVAVLKAYRDLPDGEKNYLTEEQRAFAEKLNEALKAYYKKFVTPAEIAELITRLANAADAGTAPDKDALEAARAAYDALTDEEKDAFDPDTLVLLEMLEAALAVAPMSDEATTIKVNGGAEVGGATLEAALTTALGGADVSTVTGLEIISGTMPVEKSGEILSESVSPDNPNWGYLKKLTGLTHFELKSEVTLEGGIIPRIYYSAPQSSNESAFPSTITTVIVPQVTKPVAYVFQNCNKLKSLNLPNTEMIGAFAFSGCSELAELRLPATPPRVTSTTAFTGCPRCSNSARRGL